MKNFKIYTFLLGIIVGTIVFNVISVEQLRKKVLYVFVTVIIGGFLENILIFLLWKITTYGIEKAKNNTYIVLLKNNKFFKRKMCLIFPLKPYIIGISR